MSYQLSYSSLSIFKECMRCFYQDRKLKLPRPQGIKSGVPVAVDKIIKEQFEPYRGKLPPCLQGDPRLDGFVLYDGPELKKMRHWKSNPLKMRDSEGNVIVGAFDDLLFNAFKCEFAYLDYKSTGKEPDQEFGEKYYASQCDIYTRFLIEDGRRAAAFGVLLFFWPCESRDGFVEFKSKSIFLKPDPDSAVELFDRAIKCLTSDITPPAGADCEYCAYVSSTAAPQLSGI